MIQLQSGLERQEDEFIELKQFLEQNEFTLGGNWDYDHGYFDRALDEGRKVWIRIPFQVTDGTLDANAEDPETKVRIGTPFVLKHLYNEGLDKTADMQTSGGLVNQFQDPVESDAAVDNEWVEKAQEILREVENRYLQ
ncbi:YugN family protein [Ferviditalea candida]|uniref:YugN family protein n=1 Tax=Ferviditalea candida TaxID=3108399 RepID=A0ABU5ZME3_9BACL|nr:YugN family protein [Paenibacillaceae bacterium T2]